MKRIFGLLFLIFLAASIARAQRLPEIATPENYRLTLTPNLEKATFDGDETIAIRILKPTSQITLNSAAIEFHEVTITSAGSTQQATVTPETKDEMAVLSVEKPLPAGPATLHITYSGTLNNEMRGFYLGKDDHGRLYASTQFESTDARRAFPSFDEPAYKVTFDITAVIDRGLIAISNQKVASDTEGPADKHTVRFATTARMSSYLAALVVGNFESIEGEADGIPIRVYATPGKKELSKFALEAAAFSLHYFNNYFGIKYPYGKLDLVGVPDFSAGAMENTGCITFRESSLLIDENRGTISNKKNIAETIAHEIAHQWFGDLVTMKWWDDIWLNEGFASWMETRSIKAWKPEWHIDLDEVTNAGNALNLDSLANTRPIEQSAETPGQILELFDGIAYDKAPAVLRMLESYLGNETFQAGVNAYLKEHRDANATSEDFWNALARTSHTPVDKIMPTWIRQAGPPIVDVKTECSGNSTRVTLTQQRYYYNRARFESPGDQLWQIPVCMKGSAGAAAKCELLTRKQETFTLPGCSNWVLANAGGDGYYRAGYDANAVRALAADVESRLSSGERIALQADIWASMRVGREPVGDYLALVQGLQSDRNRAVFAEVLRRLEYIDHYLVGENDHDAYRAWLRQFLKPVIADVGWDPRPGENGEQKAFRSRLLGALGVARDPEAIAQARKIADQALADPASVDSDTAGPAFAVAALTGDAAFYDKLRSALKDTKSQHYYRYFFTLAEFSDPELAKRTLEFAVSPDVRSQDSMQLIARVLANPALQQVAWDFIQQHWPEVEKEEGPFASAEVVQATTNFCQPALRDQVTEFFKAHWNDAGERFYRQSIEFINNCVDLKSRQEPQLASWLGKRGSTGE